MNTENLNINSEDFSDFKKFILELKKLNQEYIQYKNKKKTILGKSKTFGEFISIALEDMSKSNFIQKESQMLKGIQYLFFF